MDGSRYLEDFAMTGLANEGLVGEHGERVRNRVASPERLKLMSLD